MRKIALYLAVIASLNLFAVQKSHADDATYQVVITTDGHEHVFPAEMSQDTILFFIDWYEYWLDYKEWYNSQPKPIPC
jgi:hypothetical protein